MGLSCSRSKLTFQSRTAWSSFAGCWDPAGLDRCWTRAFQNHTGDLRVPEFSFFFFFFGCSPHWLNNLPKCPDKHVPGHCSSFQLVSSCTLWDLHIVVFGSLPKAKLELLLKPSTQQLWLLPENMLTSWLGALNSPHISKAWKHLEGKD